MWSVVYHYYFILSPAHCLALHTLNLDQHLRARDSAAVARQLCRGLVGRESLDEVHGDAAQRPGLLRHFAEEAGASSGHTPVCRAGIAIRGPQEHQSHRAETVNVWEIRLQWSSFFFFFNH